ncbi:hypothetical protein [Candidatus Burkholderia verschuerenii]|uniref:hypothetical protein n=1 Tax=Candidatus Burkholderia verschuerenii TaxID=242163 RepID=UPI00067BB361|nr:hypothetical protein [Candidatus Burkholderia verschuerenii]
MKQDKEAALLIAQPQAVLQRDASDKAPFAFGYYDTTTVRHEPTSLPRFPTHEARDGRHLRKFLRDRTLCKKLGRTARGQVKQVFWNVRKAHSYGRKRILYF